MKFTSKMIKKAWAIRKEAASKFNCKVMDISWSLCLKQAIYNIDISFKNTSNHFNPNKYTITINNNGLCSVSSEKTAKLVIEWIKKNIPNDIQTVEKIAEYISKNRTLRIQLRTFCH